MFSYFHLVYRAFILLANVYHATKLYELSSSLVSIKLAERDPGQLQVVSEKNNSKESQRLEKSQDDLDAWDWIKKDYNEEVFKKKLKLVSPVSFPKNERFLAQNIFMSTLNKKVILYGKISPLSHKISGVGTGRYRYRGILYSLLLPRKMQICTPPIKKMKTKIEELFSKLIKSRLERFQRQDSPDF